MKMTICLKQKKAKQHSILPNKIFPKKKKKERKEGGKFHLMKMTTMMLVVSLLRNSTNIFIHPQFVF